uniref:(northern house mosquito) hypothetical protein n=1 Tax=Culex pipiens TaxID=7175 RepID=A0A8D8MJ84_CULPI
MESIRLYPSRSCLYCLIPFENLLDNLLCLLDYICWKVFFLDQEELQDSKISHGIYLRHRRMTPLFFVTRKKEKKPLQTDRNSKDYYFKSGNILSNSIASEYVLDIDYFCKLVHRHYISIAPSFPPRMAKFPPRGEFLNG